jgi:hypothetical protein
MVSQITVGTSPVIRFGLGLYFIALVMAFDVTLNTNVCLSSSMSPVQLPMLSISALLSSWPCMCSSMMVCPEECRAELRSSRYWGQNSYGATNPSNTAAWQQPIGYYCGVCDSLVTGGGNTSLIHLAMRRTTPLTRCLSHSSPSFIRPVICPPSTLPT